MLTAIASAASGFAADPHRVERWYVHGFGPDLAAVPNALTRWIPMSVAELVIAVAIVMGLAWLVGRARAVVVAERPRPIVLAEAAGTVYVSAVTIGLLFYAVWGMAYARPELEVRQGWAQPADPPASVRTWELELLAQPLVDRVNALYLELHGVPDAFAPTRAPRGMAAADAAVDAGWLGAVAALHLSADVARSRGPTKPLLSSSLFSWLRISGMYFPFTAEANVNRQAPEWQQPFTMAHEKAHQRFVASENEANFHGMLACIHSDDPFVQYSGWLFAQRQVLRALSSASPWSFVTLVEQRLPGVQRDVDHAHAFWSGYRGPLADLSESVNDAYLRANRVRGGVQSYGRSLELIVLYARHSGWPTADHDKGSPLEDP